MAGKDNIVEAIGNIFSSIQSNMEADGARLVALIEILHTKGILDATDVLNIHKAGLNAAQDARFELIIQRLKSPKSSVRNHSLRITSQAAGGWRKYPFFNHHLPGLFFWN